ncbi:MAG: hypothetical protein WC989_09475 [Micavibrio sp.]
MGFFTKSITLLAAIAAGVAVLYFIHDARIQYGLGGALGLAGALLLGRSVQSRGKNNFFFGVLYLLLAVLIFIGPFRF